MTRPNPHREQLQRVATHEFAKAAAAAAENFAKRVEIHERTRKDHEFLRRKSRPSESDRPTMNKEAN